MPTPIIFSKATRKQAKAAILITGLQGSGKSGLALALAATLAGGDWDKIYATDAENKSLSLFVDTTLHTGQRVNPFNVLELSNETGYKPSLYQAARDTAIANGGLVNVADSVTHMWQYKGGVLDMVNTAKQNGTNKNEYAVWGNKDIAEERNIIMDMMRSPYIHTVNTCRVKEKSSIETDADTHKTTIKKLGEQVIFAPGIEYEPDLVIRMIRAGNETEAPVARIDKSRYSILTVDQLYVFDAKLMEQLKAYLDEGADPEVLKEQQRQDYITGLTTHLDQTPETRQIWTLLKDKAGFKDVKLQDMPLNAIKQIYNELIS